MILEPSSTTNYLHNFEQFPGAPSPLCLHLQTQVTRVQLVATHLLSSLADLGL